MAAEPAVELDWTKAENSSNVKAFAYDEPTEVLAVRFQNGSLYSYSGVNLEIYTAFAHAPSLGKFLNNVIKGVNPYTLWDSESALLSDLHHRRK